MNNSIAEITSVSTKGQVVLPKAIRESLSLVSGSKLLVFSDGENILMKPIVQPDIAEFSELMEQSQRWAAENGMKESDIEEAILAVRHKRRRTQ